MDYSLQRSESRSKETAPLVQMEDDGGLNLNRSRGFPGEKFRADI